MIVAALFLNLASEVLEGSGQIDKVNQFLKGGLDRKRIVGISDVRQEFQ